MARAVIILLLLGFARWGGAAELILDFSKFVENQPPAGFSPRLTGKGEAPVWKVLLDEVPATLAPLTAQGARTVRRPVIAQTSRDTTDERFPLLVYEGDDYADFTLTTRFKLVDGQAERMAGVAFRIQDEKNYYVLRASGTGNSLRFYKFVNGIRSQPIGPQIEIPSGVWHELTVECKANKIRCSFNGREAIPELTDNSFSVGKVGYWTKSDSVTYFADTRIQYVPREMYAQKLVQSMLEKYPRLLGLKIYAQPTGGKSVLVIGSDKAEELKTAADEVPGNAISNDAPYINTGKTVVKVTMPLHDRNGDPVAAVRVELKPFTGQTEMTSLTRAMVIAKEIESRFKSHRELFE